jgi:predicted ATP-dependent serine protease
MARTIGPVLYSSGEESEHQIKSRGERLAVGHAPLYLLAETCLERIPRRDRRASSRRSSSSIRCRPCSR